jgi:hypothetical protein
MKTAIQTAKTKIAELWSSPSDQPTYSQIFKILEESEPELKQQIIKAYDDAFKYVAGSGFVTKTGKQYFEEMYNDK